MIRFYSDSTGMYTNIMKYAVAALKVDYLNGFANARVWRNRYSNWEWGVTTFNCLEYRTWVLKLLFDE